MKITLAGYNVDADVLKDLSSNDFKKVLAATPETISAAYARISRAPDDVSTLRRKSTENVSAARLSNKRIVFDYGHASIAEHAVLNFDVEGVSRLAIEAIEHSRLASYTEKSQRYTAFDPDDTACYVIPQDIKGTSFESTYVEFMRRSMEAYQTILKKLQMKESVENKAFGCKKKHSAAMEDARYVTPLAVHGQLGMTLNARSLETMIRRLVRHPLGEVVAIGRALQREAKKVVPSLIRHIPDEVNKEHVSIRLPRDLMYIGMFDAPASTMLTRPVVRSIQRFGDENDILAGYLYKMTQYSYRQCLYITKKLSEQAKKSAFESIFATLNEHEPPSRAFENIVVDFEVVVSSACYAQLKRHRMMSMLTQDYNPELRYFVPPALVNDDFIYSLFTSVYALSNQLYKEAFDLFGLNVAEYILTQAHRRCVHLKMNLRTAYNFCRLRCSPEAQYEIRLLAEEIARVLRREFPYASYFLGSKEEFKQKREDAERFFKS